MSFSIMAALLALAAPGGAPVVTEICPASNAPALAELADAGSARQVLAGLLTPDAISPAAGGRFNRGAAEVAARLAPEGAAWRWSVVRSAVSADGGHGFTAGYLDETGADGKAVPFKFLAYWVRAAEGWRIAAFRKAPMPQGVRQDARTAPAPCLRSGVTMRGETVPGDAAAHRASLAAAEQRFSDDAQAMGIGPAFAKHGSALSLNMGRGAGLTLGAEAIGAEIAASNPPPLAWGSDGVLVAPGGDLGLSWGVIRIVGSPDDERGRFAFFTVWHRAGPAEPWRYIAE